MAEVLIVVSIFLVLTVIGWTSMDHRLPRYRLVKVAKGMEGDITKLRMMAIQTNRQARLHLDRADETTTDPESWGGAWTLALGDASLNATDWDVLPRDSETDGSDDRQAEGFVDIGPDGDQPAKGVGLAPWDSLTGPASGNADSIVFTPRGWVANPAMDFDADGYITLRLVNKHALRKGVRDEVHLRVARSGYVRLESTLDPGDDAMSVGTAGSTANGS